MPPIAHLLVGLLVGAFVAWLWAARGRRRARRAVRRAAARGYAGERAAVGILEAAGYTIVEAQPSATYPFWIDDVEHEAEMCPDLVVRRHGIDFVVEVKTGRGRRPTTRGTRRQLLEYATYFDAAGALLVDPEGGRIFTVEFPAPTPPRTAGGSLWLVILSFVAGLLLGWLANGPH